MSEGALARVYVHAAPQEVGVLHTRVCSSAIMQVPLSGSKDFCILNDCARILFNHYRECSDWRGQVSFLSPPRGEYVPAAMRACVSTQTVGVSEFWVDVMD